MKAKFRKHSISRLLAAKAGASKSSNTHGAKSKGGHAKDTGKSSRSGKDDSANDEHRRRSKRERHIPQKLGSSEVIQDVNDRDVIFGRPSGGVTLHGNRLLVKLLADFTIQDSSMTR